MLNTLHKKYGKIEVWLDILCIRQDEQDEKSEQVQRMGNIYRRATGVYAWLGDINPETNLVFKVLQEFRDCKRSAEFVRSVAGLDAAEEVSVVQQKFCQMCEQKAVESPKHCKTDPWLHKELNWLRPLYSQGLWRRVWIVQELILAKSVTVHCGEQSMDLHDIYGLSLDWGNFGQAFNDGIQYKLQPESRGWLTIQAIRDHRRVVSQHSSQDFAALDKEHCIKLDEAIMIYARYHDCTDPRDKIYGLRELVWEWRDVKVDYGQSLPSLYREVKRCSLLDAENKRLHLVLPLLEVWRSKDVRLWLEFQLRHHLPKLLRGERPSLRDLQEQAALSRRTLKRT